MNKRKLLKVVKAAKETALLSQEVEAEKLRKDFARKLHIKQYESTERDVTEVVSQVIDKQVNGITDRLAEMVPDQKSEPGMASLTLVDLSFNQRVATEELIDSMLPVMAIKMAEAAVAQMVMFGVNPKSKGARLLVKNQGLEEMD